MVMMRLATERENPSHIVMTAAIGYDDRNQQKDNN